MSLVARDFVQDELAMPAPLLKEKFIVLKQSLGLRRVMTVFGPPLDGGNLLDHELFARGDVNIYRGEVLAVFRARLTAVLERMAGTWRWRLFHGSEPVPDR
ncbi:hypothetical protein BB934_31810 (plasmid) [Microvirga ossetica]|uniref:Uncharacterized protein n=1 Tax=Microvirga ossetica TaxID=1882682 RepID=A0A1B2ES74_9HYPH|nr:hypothetical protein [Microvirga ossetica]ANY82824.1 hypothetical protein BB934_31810 [Microvirga ossetica]